MNTVTWLGVVTAAISATCVWAQVVTTTGGVNGTVPKYSGPSVIGNSVISESHSNIGVGGVPVNIDPGRKLQVFSSVPWDGMRLWNSEPSGAGSVFSMFSTGGTNRHFSIIGDARSHVDRLDFVSTFGRGFSFQSNSRHLMDIYPSGIVELNGALKASGQIESTTGGFRFPDGTTQATATAQGPEGARGPVGPPGPKGDPGPQGAPGGIASLNGATGVVSLAQGTNITISRTGNTITISAPVPGCKCIWYCCSDSSCSSTLPQVTGKADNIHQCQAAAWAACPRGYRSLSCNPY